MKLFDLFDKDLFEAMVNAGYVKVTRHPEAGLSIGNYSPKTQWEKMWNEVTLQCRGLIWNDSFDLVARPMRKFFNYGEMEELPEGPFEVYDKMDGSLGIMYSYDGYYRIATRGSFTSDQAIHATQTLRLKYPTFRPPDGFTYLFEIIYPENRIVVDYEGQDDLILIDVIHNETGQSFIEFMMETWPGPIVAKYEFDSLEEIVARQRENREGFVLKFSDDTRVKVKHSEYVRLHRIVTMVTAKTIWEYLSEGRSVNELLDHVPDEFYDWVRKTRRQLHNEYNLVFTKARLEFNKCLDWTFADLAEFDLSPDSPGFRKAFAKYAVQSDYRPECFLQLDRKSIDQAIWKRIVPTAERPFMAQSEDAN